MNASIFPDVSDWYYFLASPPRFSFNEITTGRIPSICVSPGSCGTENPIWIDGELPTGKAFILDYSHKSRVCETINYATIISLLSVYL